MARTSLLLVALLGLLLVFLPTNESGTRWLSQLVQRLTPLEIEHRSGSLTSGPAFSRLAYTSGQLQLELRDVFLQLELDCLWRSTLCFSQLEVGELNIELAAGEVPDAPADGGGADLDQAPPTTAFPLAVEAVALHISAARVHWPGGEWRQADAEFRAVKLRGSEISIKSAVLAATELVLSPSKDEETKPAGRIELPEIRLPFKLSLAELSLRGPRWDIYGTVLEHEALYLGGHWQDASLALSRLELVSRELGLLTAAGDIEFSQDWPLYWTGQLKIDEQRGIADFPGGPVQIELSGSVSALVARLSSSGRGEISAELGSDLLDPLLPFTLGMEVSGVDALPVAEFAEVPEQLAGLLIEFPVRADISGTRDRQQFDLLGAFSGLGYEAGVVAASGERVGSAIQLHSVVLQDEQSDSKLEASGEVLIADETVLSLLLVTPGINLPDFVSSPPGRVWGDMALKARLGNELWDLAVSDIRIQGQVDGRDAIATGDLFLNQDWFLGETNLRVVANGADLSLTGAGNGSREGRLGLVIEDVGRWQGDSRGRIDLQATVSPGLQLLQFEAGLDNFAWGELQVDSGQLTGRVALGAGEFDVSLQAQSLAAADLELSRLTLTTSGDRHKQSMHLESDGDIQGKFRLSGTAWGENWSGTLAPVQLQTSHGTWRSDSPVSMAWSPASRQLAMDSHCWLREDASACFQDLRLGPAGSLVLSARGDMANLESLLPAGIKVGGMTEISLDGSWNGAGETLFLGRWSTRSAAFTRHYGEGESAHLNWDHGEGSFRFEGKQLALQWSIHRDGRRILGIDARIPVARNEPIIGDLSVAQLQLEPLLAFLPALAELRGSVTGRLALSGTRDKPEATGLMRLTDGRVLLVGNPTALEAIDLAVDLRGNRATIKGSGLVGGGSVQLDGELLLQPQWTLQLQIDGAKQRVLYPPATELLLSEQLTVQATSGLVEISGDIIVHEGRLEPEELPENSVAVSSHIVEVDYQGNVIREMLPFDLSLNVRVKVEDRFKVRTSLLFATIGGELNLLQRPRQPLQLFGTLRVVDGHVSAYQQKLQIQRGIFSFTGRPDNPGVNVRAVRKLSGSNVVVGMQVIGTYEALSMEVFSEPRMSDGEAMSYLVRGRGLDTSAGEDGTALALSMASGVVNRSTLVDELNSIPGISDVSFGAEGADEDTAATVSGFIGERIFLAYGVGVYEPINVLIARLYLRTRLWLEVVSRLENSVDLYYAFDID